MERFDQFIGYLFKLDEAVSELTPEQLAKLKTIQGKVNDIVDKLQNNNPATPQALAEKPIEQQQQLELALAENKVHRFAEYVEINKKK